MPLPAIIGVVALVGIVFALWLHGYSVRRLVSRHMQSRQPRTLDEFGSHFFGPDAAPIAKRLREILARQVSVDLSRLSPDDRFIEDLQMVELDSLSTVNLVVDIEREFGIKIPDADAGKIRTLRDLVEYVSRTAKHTAA